VVFLVGLIQRRSKFSEEQLEDLKAHLSKLLVEAGQRPEWRDIAVHSPTYKSYWAQWKSLVVRDGVLERLWESADGRTKAAQVLIPRSKVKDVLTEMHGGPSGGHLGVKKTVDKVSQRY
jgi:hypothetical protein